jgi:hypothetical protein
MPCSVLSHDPRAVAPSVPRRQWPVHVLEAAGLHLLIVRP